MDIYQFFAEHEISYERYDHPPVFTCEEAERLTPPMPPEAKRTKNLFLRDKKGRQHFLVTVGYGKMVDVKALEPLLGVNKLSFASPKRLEKYLGLTPGAVTILGVLNDRAHDVQVVIDQDVWQAPALCCHPLVNTSTLVMTLKDIQRFLDLTGHEPQILDVPAKVPAA